LQRTSDDAGERVAESGCRQQAEQRDEPGEGGCPRLDASGEHDALARLPDGNEDGPPAFRFRLHPRGRQHHGSVPRGGEALPLRHDRYVEPRHPSELDGQASVGEEAAGDEQLQLPGEHAQACSEHTGGLGIRGQHLGGGDEHTGRVLGLTGIRHTDAPGLVRDDQEVEAAAGAGPSDELAELGVGDLRSEALGGERDLALDDAEALFPERTKGPGAGLEPSIRSGIRLTSGQHLERNRRRQEREDDDADEEESESCPEGHGIVTGSIARRRARCPPRATVSAWGRTRLTAAALLRAPR
jgi:hypothetical protein